MISLTRVCTKCGAEIPVDAPEGGCPGCLLESGIRLLDEEALADGAAGSARRGDTISASAKEKVLSSASNGTQHVRFGQPSKHADWIAATTVPQSVTSA